MTQASNPFAKLPENGNVHDTAFTPDGKHFIAALAALPDRTAFQNAIRLRQMQAKARAEHARLEGKISQTLIERKKEAGESSVKPDQEEPPSSDRGR